MSAPARLALALALLLVPFAAVIAHRGDDDTPPAARADAAETARPFVIEPPAHHAAERWPEPTGASLGPDVVMIDVLAHVYEAVSFDHRRHAEMSRLGGGCANCHHDLHDGTGAVVACRTCHDPTGAGATLDVPGLRGAYHRQCLGCHRDWRHANACVFCHEPVAAGAAWSADATDIVGIEHPPVTAHEVYVYRTALESAPFVTFDHSAHTARFGLTCVDCHRGSSCGQCHGPEARPLAVQRTATCGACHAAEGRCGFCHDEHARPPFEHALRAGWDLMPHHASVACAACHGAARTFTVPLSTNCRGCHGRSIDPETFDHRRVGVPLVGSHRHFECARCHTERDAEAPASCAGCHVDKSYPAQWPGDPTPH